MCATNAYNLTNESGACVAGAAFCMPVFGGDAASL